MMQYMSPQRRARATQISLALLVAVNTIGIVLLLQNFAVASDIANGAPSNVDVIRRMNIRAFVVAVPGLLLSISTIVSFLLWMTRLKKNVEADGTPIGWAGLWFFIPFANIYKPYAAMKAIWMASESLRSGAFLGLWWGLYLSSGVVAWMSLAGSGGEASFDAIAGNYAIGTVRLFAEAVAALACLYMVKRVTDDHIACLDPTSPTAVAEVFEQDALSFARGARATARGGHAR